LHSEVGESSQDPACALSPTFDNRLRRQGKQQIIDYDPQPPFDAGRIAKAGAEMMNPVLEYSNERD
jgi:hypothetical protein